MDSNQCNDIPEAFLRNKPVEPLPSDCCGNGCNLCVFDIYQQELRIWKCELQKHFSPQETESEKQKSVIEPESYTKFKLVGVVPQVAKCSIYRFQITGGRSLGSNMGQHLIMRGIVDGESITRQYTPINPVDAEGYFDVLIKLYDYGKMSKYINQWQIGENVDWRGPFGHFQYKANSFQRIIIAVAGTGITPSVQIIDHILEDESDDTYIRMLFGCCYYDDILLKAKINNWKRYWNFSVLYCLSQEQNQEKRKYGEEIYYGRINQSLLNQEVGPNKSNTLVLVCGSNDFNVDVEGFAKFIGVSSFFTFW